MSLFRDARSCRKFSETLVTLLRRVKDRDYSGVTHPAHERSIDELTEGQKIVGLGELLFREARDLSFMLHDTYRGRVVGMRTLFDADPEIKGTFSLRDDHEAREDRCDGFEIVFSYKMPNGSRHARERELPRDYVKANALELMRFVEGLGRLPSEIVVKFPEYNTTVYFSRFEGNVTDGTQVREYIARQTLEGIEMDRRGSLERIDEYYGGTSPARKKEEIERENERFDKLKTVVSDPSTEFYCTEINYHGGSLDFTRGIMRRSTTRILGEMISNEVKLKLRDISLETLDTIPKLLKMYLTSEAN